MRLFAPFIPALFAVLALTGCARQETGGGKPVSSRIQYDVTIKSPDPSFDWWVQNIDGASREVFVRQILEAAYEGKVRAYDVFHHLIPPAEVQQIGRKTDTVTFQRAEPPYELFDTVVTQSFTLSDISRIRFLEEWTMDPVNLQMSKRVIGICPLLERYGQDGILRGYMPMFWVYFDEAYPAAFSAGTGE